jgi:hypothetical protein
VDMARTKNRARRTSHLYLPSAFDLFTPSKDIVLKNIWIFGPLYAVLFVFFAHSWLWSPPAGQHVRLWQHSDGFSSGWLGGPLPAYFTFLAVGFSLLWLALTLVVGTTAQIMSQAAQLDAVEDKHLDFQNLWQVVKTKGWRLLGLYIVMSLIIGLGFVLLFIPGLFMIRRYIMAPYVMIDKNTGIQESLTKSAAISLKNTGAVWGIIGVLFLIGLVNIIPYFGGLAAFVLGSLYSVAPALRYQQLKKLA